MAHDYLIKPVMLYNFTHMLCKYLCTRLAKWVERPPNVMRQSERWNSLQTRSCRYLNSGGWEIWPTALPVTLRRPRYNSTENVSRGPISTYDKLLKCHWNVFVDKMSWVQSSLKTNLLRRYLGMTYSSVIITVIVLLLLLLYNIFENCFILYMVLS